MRGQMCPVTGLLTQHNLSIGKGLRAYSWQHKAPGVCAHRLTLATTQHNGGGA